VGDAVRLVNGNVARPAALHELVAQPALADAGVGDDADDPTVAGDCWRELRLECLHLIDAADEARESA
jgi:hypothetical protein